MWLSQVRLFTGLCLSWLAGCAANPARPSLGEYQVSGELKGVGGSTLPTAQAQLFKLGRDEPPVRATATAGHFTLVAPGPGDYSLQFVAPGYPVRSVYLRLLPDEREVSLEATLEPYHYREEPFWPEVVVGSRDELDLDLAEPMQAQPDGSWVLERAAPGDSVTYGISGLLPDTNVEICVDAADYELSVYVSYLCRAPVKEGRIRIVFDPKKLPRAPGLSPLQVTFAPPYAFLNPLNALHARAVAWSARPSRQTSTPDSPGTLPDELLGFARDAKQPLLFRQLAALDLLSLPGHAPASVSPGGKGEAMARELLQILPPDSPTWGLSSSSAESVERLVRLMPPEEASQCVNDFVERNPEVLVQLHALHLQFARAQETRDAEREKAVLERILFLTKTLPSPPGCSPKTPCRPIG